MHHPAFVSQPETPHERGDPSVTCSRLLHEPRRRGLQACLHVVADVPRICHGVDGRCLGGCEARVGNLEPGVLLLHVDEGEALCGGGVRRGGGGGSGKVLRFGEEGGKGGESLGPVGRWSFRWGREFKSKEDGGDLPRVDAWRLGHRLAECQETREPNDGDSPVLRAELRRFRDDKRREDLRP